MVLSIAKPGRSVLCIRAAADREIDCRLDVLRIATKTKRLRAAASVVLMIGLVEGCLSGALTRVEERPQLDEYGGIAVKLTRPTGFFHTAKIKDRWMFIDPLGNPFWMLGIFHMGTVGSKLPLGPTNDEIVLQKYGNRATWASQMLARMDSWGFNTVAEESSDYFNPPRRPADSAKKPIVLILNTALYILNNVVGFAPGPF